MCRPARGTVPTSVPPNRSWNEQPARCGSGGGGLASRPMTDEPRFLGRVAGYVNHPARALRGEPEAVSATEQGAITADAGRAAEDRDRAEWLESRDRLQRELAWLYSRRFRADVTTQLAALQRQVDRLDARLDRR
jgi:hypothetical protein